MENNMLDQQLASMLAEIQKHLAMISAHLDTLARVARYEHPEVFKPQNLPRPGIPHPPQETPPQVPPGRL
jgi:hypothetical protein